MLTHGHKGGSDRSDIKGFPKKMMSTSSNLLEIFNRLACVHKKFTEFLMLPDMSAEMLSRNAF